MASKKTIQQPKEVTLQSLDATLQLIRKDLVSSRKEIFETHQKLMEQEKKIESLERETAEIRGEVGGYQKDRMEFTAHMSRVDFERMMYFLRFQNVPEAQDEDLRDIVGEMLAGYINRSKEFVLGDIDLVYRINSTYARINELPREIHVKFVRRSTRDEVLRAQRNAPLIYQSKQVTILKQIPKKIREIRRKYSFLSHKLFQKGVWFKWWMPEGLLIFWEGGRVRIKTIEEAQAFLTKHSSVLEDEAMETEGATAPPVEGGDDQAATTRKLRSQK